jgi:S1-C subfamily serine protease
MSEGRLPVIAIGLAVVAVLLAGIATIVVATRGAPAAEPTAQTAAPEQPAIRRITAEDVVELEREAVEPVSARGAVVGVKVIDDRLRSNLGLGPTDVITAISGRAIRRQFDVRDVLLGAGMMNTTALFVELLRDDTPVLVRWDLDGDLRQARRSAIRPPTTAGLLGRRVPSNALVRDPLVDTITQIDDHHVTVPRATIEQIAADPTKYAQSARLLAAIRFGVSDGIRVYIVRQTSVLWSLGLRSLDTLTAVNGIPLTDPARLRDVYEQVKTAATLRIELTRRGAAEVIEITQTP